MRAELLKEIDGFIELTGMASTTFGVYAVNDGKFVKRLREGRRCYPETIDRVRGYMRSYMEKAVKDRNAA